MRGDWVEVMPAYGRDYNSKAAALKDWRDGKDFIETSTRRYMSIRDAEREGLKVTIRYANLLKVCSTR